MNSRERADLDRYITGNYGEDQFKGEAEFEAEVAQLLIQREKAKAQLRKVEAELDRIAGDWREWID